MSIPKSGVISSCAFHILCSPGTNENISLYIRVNNTTDYLVSNSISLPNYTNNFSITALNIPVTSSDFIEFKLVMPSSMVTLPTALAIGMTIAIDL